MSIHRMRQTKAEGAAVGGGGVRLGITRVGTI